MRRREARPAGGGRPSRVLGEGAPMPCGDSPVAPMLQNFYAAPHPPFPFQSDGRVRKA